MPPIVIIVFICLIVGIGSNALNSGKHGIQISMEKTTEALRPKEQQDIIPRMVILTGYTAMKYSCTTTTFNQKPYKAIIDINLEHVLNGIDTDDIIIEQVDNMTIISDFTQQKPVFTTLTPITIH